MEFVPDIIIDLKTQTLSLMKDGQAVSRYSISSAAAGEGTESGSCKTPVGRFRIRRKIGEGVPVGTIFRGRVPVGVWHSGERSADDLITSRILWLDGLDEKNANTFDRYIYIHGTNHEEYLGTSCSHGCIRMRNDDIVSLFSFVSENAFVEILSASPA